MEFILYCVDKPRRAALRSTLRVPHLAHIRTRQQVFRYGGPMLDADGQPRGSLMILDLPDRAALDAHMQGDPYFGADLFESVTIWSTRQVMPESAPGGLERELAAARLTAAAAAGAGNARRDATVSSRSPRSIPLLKVSGEHAP
jgi:uncharacterized protein YciI